MMFRTELTLTVVYDGLVTAMLVVTTDVCAEKSCHRKERFERKERKEEKKGSMFCTLSHHFHFINEPINFFRIVSPFLCDDTKTILKNEYENFYLRKLYKMSALADSYYKKRTIDDMVNIGNFMYVCPLMCTYANTNLLSFIKHYENCTSNLTQTLNIDEIYLSYKDDDDPEDDENEETYTVKDYVDRQTTLIYIVREFITTNILHEKSHEPFENIRQFIIDKLLFKSNTPNRYLYWDLFQIYCFFFDATKEQIEIMLGDMIPKL